MVASNTRDNVFMSKESRIFYLADDIDNSSACKIGFGILDINAEDDGAEESYKSFTRKPIILYINSRGGSATDMWSLIDIILNSKTPVHTYCTGLAASAAFKIFLAGHKRFISKHTTLMYHSLWASPSGMYQDLVENQKELEFRMKQVEEYVLERTKLTPTMLEESKVSKKNLYFHGEEALQHGLADEIM